MDISERIDDMERKQIADETYISTIDQRITLMQRAFDAQLNRIRTLVGMAMILLSGSLAMNALMFAHLGGMF